MSISTTSGGSVARLREGRLSVWLAGAMPCSMRRRSSDVPRALACGGGASTGSANGWRRLFGQLLGHLVPAVVMLSKSACARRSRSEKLNSVSKRISSWSRQVPRRASRFRRRCRQRLSEPVGAAGSSRHGPAPCGQQVHHLLEQLGVAEGVEGGVEWSLLLVALKHDGGGCGRARVSVPGRPLPHAAMAASTRSAPRPCRQSRWDAREVESRFSARTSLCVPLVVRIRAVGHLRSPGLRSSPRATTEPATGPRQHRDSVRRRPRYRPKGWGLQAPAGTHTLHPRSLTAAGPQRRLWWPGESSGVCPLRANDHLPLSRGLSLSKAPMRKGPNGGFRHERLRQKPARAEQWGQWYRQRRFFDGIVDLARAVAGDDGDRRRARPSPRRAREW